jgi:membrane associated rhomboid family serine protease
MAYRERLPFAFQLTPWVQRLLIANAAVFFVTFLVGTDFMVDWFGFWPTRLLTRPWGIVTYMFVHGGFWHLFWNMVALFFFGPPLEAKWGSREFLKFYAWCAAGGALLSLVFAPNPIVGASAAVYGIMLAFAMNWPDSPIYIWGILPVKAKWFVGFLFGVSFISAAGGGPGGGIAHAAHLGGLITAFLYLKSDWRPGAKLESFKRSRPARRRLAIVPREEEDSSPDGTRRGRAKRTSNEDERLLDEVDRVLDKISAEGMGALTEEERVLLDRVSRMHRTN